MAQLDNLQKIKRAEEESNERIELANKKGEEMLKEAQAKSLQIVAKARQQASALRESALRDLDASTKKLEDKLLDEARSKAARIKPLDKKDLLVIFESVLKEEFKI